MNGECGLTLVVMGVCGVGKTSVARALADRMSGLYVEADEFHPPENIEAMRRGVPLNDAMRGPWLRGIAREVRQQHEADIDKDIVVACSALKQSYRDILRSDLPNAKFVFLNAPRDVIAERMTARTNHFMPLTLLDSQLADLEPPTTAEDHIALDASLSQGRIVDDVLAKLNWATHDGGPCLTEIQQEET
ncbi:gluconokinase [Ruegeria profundi]|uniref:gluconokinase n=1 Tax=Ruegeria profundi TaxID=1685378 RepID=UPI001CD1F906|nr:gluconokinase [Ruegeria profundi]MCA0928269.1 gluconokinase [Ruegeria profundi]